MLAEDNSLCHQVIRRWQVAVSGKALNLHSQNTMTKFCLRAFCCRNPASPFLHALCYSRPGTNDLKWWVMQFLICESQIFAVLGSWTDGKAQEHWIEGDRGIGENLHIAKEHFSLSELRSRQCLMSNGEVHHGGIWSLELFSLVGVLMTYDLWLYVNRKMHWTIEFANSTWRSWLGIPWTVCVAALYPSKRRWACYRK